MLSDISVNSTSHVLQCRLLQTAATNDQRHSLMRARSWSCKHPLLVIVATNQTYANRRQEQHLHIARPLLFPFLFFFRLYINWLDELHHIYGRSIFRLSAGLLSPILCVPRTLNLSRPATFFSPSFSGLSSHFVQSFFESFSHLNISIKRGPFSTYP